MNPQDFPKDGNDLTLRLKLWWSLTHWLITKEPTLKERES